MYSLTVSSPPDSNKKKMEKNYNKIHLVRKDNIIKIAEKFSTLHRK